MTVPYISCIYSVVFYTNVTRVDLLKVRFSCSAFRKGLLFISRTPGAYDLFLEIDIQPIGVPLFGRNSTEGVIVEMTELAPPYTWGEISKSMGCQTTKADAMGSSNCFVHGL